MNKRKSSRREFLEKITSGVISMSSVSAVGNNLFANHKDWKLPESIDPSKRIERKFVPVMVTPFNASSKIDFKVLPKLIDFYIESGAKGFFANCASSEMYKLEGDEMIALTRFVVKHVNGKFPVVASGSFGSTIEEKAEFTKKIYDTGVNAVILITSLFAEKEEGDDVFKTNLDKFLNLTNPIPVGTYECPSPYKRLLSPEILRFLLDSNRLIYHKDTSLNLDEIKEKLEIAKGSRLEFYDAHTPNAMYSLQMGAKGISCIAGNFYPEIFAWMCSNFDNPTKQKEVSWLQSEITQADEIIGQSYPLSSKYFLRKRGVPFELVTRTATSPLTKEVTDNLDKLYNRVLGWHERLGIKKKM